ncbi:hypothetical protein crov272 [Cafeteria roenbergensis virus]|uniref:Uncharacterized protein n=1 Tax=Cafeteria roenbergensis virus (strain BV-PW1) TaxID=693272 RepID=E3T542_CROVB|nr:hypothetical protein crov272 [Cafeteria roenbergensis virus BV-PW1]ADO67305.1 hypothetical protein crov272 [Cafeteria roenbergensis virus BV-PW1]
MKVALCFSGGIRNLEDNYKSIKHCLIDPLNADVFIHGWYFKVNELNNIHKMYKKKETEQNKVLILLKPKKYKFENYDINKENEMINHFDITKIKEKYKNNSNLCQLYPNTCGMFYSIYQSNKLKKEYEKENNFTYDIVIRCRPDFEYYTPLNYQVLQLVKENNILLPLDNYAFVTQQCDKFAIGTSKTMDNYSDLILYILKYEKKYPNDFWDGPNILNKHLFIKNIKTTWIYFDYEYNIRRKSQRLTNDKRIKIDYDKKTLLIIKPNTYNKV